jgi:hypothetical protein
MVDSQLIAIGGTVATVVAGAAYAYISGNDASVDIDDDGDDEITFEGSDEISMPSDENKLFDEDDIADAVDENVPDGAVEDVTGIGPTKGQNLRNADFETAADLYYASDENITDVDGIGSGVLEQIRNDIGSVDESGDGE